MFRVTVLPQVEDDLRAIQIYIADQDHKAARKLVKELRKGMKSLKQLARRCPLALENGMDGYEIRHWLYENYRVIFVVENKDVIIIEARHGARLPIREIRL